MCRRPTKPVLSGRAANVGFDKKAALRKYPPKRVSSASRAATLSGCSIDGNGRPYFSNAKDKDGEVRNPMMVRARRPRKHARTVIGRRSTAFSFPVLATRKIE